MKNTIKKSSGKKLHHRIASHPFFFPIVLALIVTLVVLTRYFLSVPEIYEPSYFPSGIPTPTLHHAEPLEL